MPLEIYKRRHSNDCLRDLEERLAARKLTIPKTQTKFAFLQHYPHCRCAWWVRGTNDYGKTFEARSLKVRSKEAALEAVKKLNQPDAVALTRITLAHARTAWKVDYTERNVAESTASLYDLAARKLLEWCATRKVTMVQQVTPTLLHDMREEWVQQGMPRNTRKGLLTWMGGLFKFCARMKWISENPVKGLAPTAIKKKKAQRIDAPNDEETTVTLPLDPEGGDDNYRKILASVGPFIRKEIKREGHRARLRTGVLSTRPETFIALLELMYETGLRISDAIHFRPDEMEADGTYTTIQIKTDKPVTVFVPEELAERLRRLPRLFGPYIFLDGRKNWKCFVHNNVRIPLMQLGEAIGIVGLRPHRFRDSFAVNCFNMGLSLGEVSKLLGHTSEEVTRDSYSPWVKSRESHLRSRLSEARRAAAAAVAAKAAGTLLEMPQNTTRRAS